MLKNFEDFDFRENTCSLSTCRLFPSNCIGCPHNDYDFVVLHSKYLNLIANEFSNN